MTNENLQSRLKEIEVAAMEINKLLPLSKLDVCKKLYDIAVEQAKEIDELSDIKRNAYETIQEKCSEIINLKAEIERLTRFIPVGDRLPETNDVVLVEYDNGLYAVAVFTIQLGAKSWQCGPRQLHNVTGWREI